MGKRYHKFFWGFLKKQEKWLNGMADRGYRLSAVGRSWYEFEDCEPGRYRYAVEFVGEKSQKDAENYAAFLEDCGYRVTYKNLNLDYSVAKAVLRPWADKGGRVATTAGTYNRELLLVEKENDGRPFALHTSGEDIARYERTLRRPFYFSAAALILALLLCAAGIFGIGNFGFVSVRSATRMGYVGTERAAVWTGRYAYLNGTMRKNMRVENDKLHIEVETGSGALTVEIMDADGSVVFNERFTGSAAADVAVSGKVKVTITAERHKGSFSIR